MSSIELTLEPGITTAAIERACRFATSETDHDVVAVAVDAADTKRAADLLFGTGVDVVGIMHTTFPLRPQARKSVAAGATEINIPFDGAHDIAELRHQLGPTVGLTLDVAPVSPTDLALVESAMASGVDYLAFQPDLASPSGLRDAAQLLALAQRTDGSEVKLALPVADYRIPEAFLTAVVDQFGQRPARICVPVRALMPDE